MKSPFIKLVITVAAVIVGAWLLMLAFRFAAWLIDGLIGIAAVVIVVAIIYRFATKRSTSSTKKTPLKIKREPSRED